MARISTYKLDNNVTQNDIVIGSDADNFNQTKNYKISDIIKTVQLGAVNNIPKIVSVVLEQGEDIPTAMQEINLEVVPDDSPVFINFLKPTLIDSSSPTLEYRKISYFFPLGNGLYEPITDHISFQDLILNSVTKPSQTDLSFLANTQTIDAGDITGSNISDWVNSRVPSLNLSDDEVLYVFTFVDNGVSFFTVFTGVNQVYGLNDNQTTIFDFTEFTNSETLSFEEDRNIKIKTIEVVPSNDFYPLLSDEIDEIVSKVNELPTFNVTQDELCLVYAEFTNPQGVSFVNKYLITRGKGSYGVGGFQISNSLLNIVKIEDGFNSQNLSDYNNDSEFITIGDVPQVNIPTNVSSFNNDSNYVNQTELENALHFRGIYSDVSSINSIANPKAGDYALLISNETQQKWVRNTSFWEIQSAKNFFKEVDSNYTSSVLDHNSTIIAKNGANEINLESTFYNIEFLIFNESGSNIVLNAVATTINGENEIFDGQSAYVSFDAKNNQFYVKRSSSEFGTRIATYNYVGSATGFFTKDAMFEFPPDVDGLGAGHKDPLAEIPDVYDAGNRLDFFLSKLKVNDIVKVQVTGKVNIINANTAFNGKFVLAKGEPNEIEYQLDSSFFPLVGEYSFNKQIEFSVGSISSIVLNSEMLFTFSQDAEINFNNVYVKIISKA